MAQQKAVAKPVTKPTVKKEEKVKLPLFEKQNYMWMGIGAVVIAIGMIIMAGGKSQSPNQFDYSSVYSSTRISIAPILILAGFVIEIFAIFKKPKVQH